MPNVKDGHLSIDGTNSCDSDEGLIEGATSVLVPDILPDLKSALAGKSQDCFGPFFTTPHRFALFDDFHDRAEGVLLAVSGGADSLALLLLCYRWQMDMGNKVPIHVATVDHGLRAEARAEAEYVGAIAAQLGLSHEILIWEADKPLSNLQSKARDGRYALLKAHAEKLGLGTIMTAHHADDQAETFVMRFLRGSSVRGLSSMSKTRCLGEIEIARPLLGVPKARLEELLDRMHLNWCEDPSNRQDKYQRVKIRQQMMPQLEEVGLNRQLIGRTATRLARAEEALKATTLECFNKIMRAEPGRALSFDLNDYASLATEFRLRLLQEAVFHVSGEGYPCEERSLLDLDKGLLLFDEAIYDAETARLERLLVARGVDGCRESGDMSLMRQRRSTLAGCCFEVLKGRLWVYREIGRQSLRLELTPDKIVGWYDIFEIQWPTSMSMEGNGPEVLVLCSLGPKGRTVLKHGKRFDLDLLKVADGRSYAGFPVGLIEALPSIWQGEQLLAVQDLPEIAMATGCPLEFLEKNTRFT